MNHIVNFPHKIPKVIHPFTPKVALGFSVVASTVHTSLMLLGNIYTEESILDTQLHILLLSVANFVLFFVLFLFNFRVAKAKQHLGDCVVRGVGGTLLITAIYSFVVGLLRLWIYDEPLVDGLLYINMIKDGVAAVVVLSVTLALFSITHRQQMLLENEQLRSENLQVRLNSLENQVDPHFLFNSLNTLDGLVGVDDSRAHEYLHQLASCYRYIIRQQRSAPLADELAFADSYIQLMQIRYGENLQVVKHIQPRYLTAQIVPISLQLLMENAIKHNVVSDRHPLTIVLETTVGGMLRVSNLLQPKNDGIPSAGVGLVNLSNRYQLLFHRDIVVTNNGSCFAVELPLIEK